MKKIKKLKLKAHVNATGKLIPFSFNKKFPIKVKRVFFIYAKKNKIRGEHAHKKCSQLFIPILGKLILNIKTPKYEKKIILDHKLKTGVLVPPKYWIKIKFLNKNSILMVACDKYYDYSDYLESFNDYKEYLKKI